MQLNKENYKKSNNLNYQSYSQFPFKAKIPKQAEKLLTDETLKLASAAIGAAGIAGVAINSQSKQNSTHQFPPEIKDFVKENLKQYIGRETYISVKNHFMDSDLDNYITYKAKSILKDYESLKPEQIDYIKSLVKEIVLERINNKELDENFSDVPKLRTKENSIKFMNLFFTKDIFEVFLEKNMIIKDIRDLINASHSTVCLKLQEFGLQTLQQKRNEEVASPEVEAKILEMQKNGVSQKQIAENLQISITTVARTYKKHNLKSPKQLYRERASDPEIIQNIIKMYNEGASLQIISEKVGTSAGTIGNILSKNNVEKHIKYYNKDAEIIKLVLGLYDKGLSINEMASEVGCSTAVIRKILAEQGVKTKKREHISEIKEKKDSVIEMYKNGYDIKTIAQNHNLRYHQVYNILYNGRALDITKNQNKDLEEANLIEQMLKNNATVEEIANSLNKSKSYIYRKIKEYELKTSMQEHKADLADAELNQKILELYENGCSVNDIANEVGYTVRQVRLLLNKSGKTTDKQKSKEYLNSPEYRDNVVKLYSQGRSISEIKQAIGGNFIKITNILKEEGLEVKYKKRKTFTTEFKQQLKELYLKNYRVEEMAEYLDCSNSTIFRMLAGLGLKTKAQLNSQRRNEILKPQIEAKINEGMSYPDIAKELNISLIRIYRILHTPHNLSERQQQKLELGFKPDELKKELSNIYFSSEKIALDENLSTMIEALDEQSDFPPEMRKEIIGFIKLLDKFTDDQISLETLLNSDTVNKIQKFLTEKEKNELETNQKIENLHNSLNNIANECAQNNARYLMKIVYKNIYNLCDNANVKDAEKVIDLFNQYGNDIKNAERALLYYDLKQDNSNQELLKLAEKYAEDENGNVDILKAGQYIYNANVLEDLEGFNPYENYLNIIKEENLPKNLAVLNLIRLENIFFENEESKIKLSDVCKEFDTKSNIDSKIIKEFITKTYINNDTVAIAKSQNGTKIRATIKPSAKQDIYKEYGYPVCLEYLTLFEEALNYIVPPKGKYGIKAVDSNNYKIELKIMGYPNRLVSSNNDYNFDIHKKDGLHSKKDL